MNDTPASTDKKSLIKPQEQSNWPFIIRLLGIAGATVILVYVVWWALLYSWQDKMIFPVDSLPTPAREPKFPNTLVLKLQLDEGGSNEAWLIPGRGVNKDKPGPMVVYCHGNAELIDQQIQIVSEYTKRGISVLLPEYRGYGRSGGTPSLVNIQKDNEKFYDTVIKQPIIDPTRIVFHGRSIGGAIAAQLASTRRPAGMILESTLASMAQMAHDRAAPAFLVKHPYKTDVVVAALKCPILLMHGSMDDVIPVQHGHMLQQANPNATYVEYECAHNDFPGMNNLPDYWKQIDKLLGEVGIDASVKPIPVRPNATDAPKAQTPQADQPAKPTTTTP
jgi:pimeloyl-ACP methyl ester carboxylesterase